MTTNRPTKLLALVLVALVAVAFSPLTNSDTGWRNTIGDIVWTGMFLVFAVLIAVAVAGVIKRLRSAS